MASPITWRNVASTASSSGVGALLETARRSADSGFAAIGSALDDARQIQKEGRELETKDNTREFRRMLSGFDSAEEFQAARDSGVMDQALDGYGRRIDDSVISEMFGQGDKYRARDTSRNVFADDQTLRGQRGTEAAIARDIAEGNTEGAEEKIGTLDMGAGKWYGALRDDERERTADAQNAERLRLAQVASSRQGQAHQARMQAAAQAQEEYKQRKGAQEFTLNGFRQRQTEMEGYRAGVGSVMNDLGFGDTSFDSLKPEQKKQVATELSARGIESPGSDSQFLRNQLSAASEDPNITPAGLTLIAEGTNNLLTGSKQVAASDQAQLTAMENAATAREAYNQQTNPLYSSDSASEQLTSLEPLIKDQLFKTNFLSIGTNQAEATQKISKWLSDGITVEDEDGVKSTVPLTAPAVKQIMEYTGWTDSYNLDSRAEDWVLDNLKQLQEAAALRTQSAARIKSVRDAKAKLFNSKSGSGASDATIWDIQNY